MSKASDRERGREIRGGDAVVVDGKPATVTKCDRRSGHGPHGSRSFLVRFADGTQKHVSRSAIDKDNKR